MKDFMFYMVIVWNEEGKVYSAFRSESKEEAKQRYNEEVRKAFNGNYKCEVVFYTNVSYEIESEEFWK